MGAYLLLGISKPFYSDDTGDRLAVVHGNDIGQAAAKLCAEVTDAWGTIRTRRRFVAIVAKAMVASQELRGKKRKDALRTTRKKLHRFRAFRLTALAPVS